MSNFLMVILVSLSVLPGVLMGETRNIPPGCQYDKPCVFQIPGSICGNGEQNYIAYTFHQSASKLMVYLGGGGSCASFSTCNCKGGVCLGGVTGGKLSPYKQNELTDWQNMEHGWGNSKDPGYFLADYDIVEIPYCTGDLHIGSRVMTYTQDGETAVVKHFGSQNFIASLSHIVSTVPAPRKVLLSGTSAGGVGALFHLGRMRRAYPGIPTYVLSDAGTPFVGPAYSTKGFDAVSRVWGVQAGLPPGVSYGSDGYLDPGDLIRYNNQKFPEVRYGFISATLDPVMSVAAQALAASPFSFGWNLHVLKEQYFNSLNSSVFYVNDIWHGYAAKNPSQVTTSDLTLGDWIQMMLNDSKSWKSETPPGF